MTWVYKYLFKYTLYWLDFLFSGDVPIYLQGTVLGVPNDGHRTIVDQGNVHHSSKLSVLDFLLAQPCSQLL